MNLIQKHIFKNFNRFVLIVAVFPAVLLQMACSSSGRVADDDIALLDSLIDRSSDLERAKLIRIDDIKQKRNRATALTDRFVLNSMLLDEFASYKSDSALKYIDENIAIAQSTGNVEGEIKCKIEKSELLAGAGLLSESYGIMQTVNASELPDSLRVDYYGQMMYLYSHLGNYAAGTSNDFYVKERAYKDSVMSVIGTNHPEYLWYKGWDVLGTEKPRGEIEDALREKLRGSALNTRQDAKDAYILAKVYQDSGDREAAIHYLVLSAIADVRTVNAEIASLEELAKLMFEEGDIDHAHSFINYSLAKAISYPSRVRAYGIMNTLEEVNKVYQERSHSQQRRTRLFLIIVGVLAMILTGAIITIIAQNNRLRRRRLNLDEANKELNRNICSLSKAQEELNKANGQLKTLNEDLKMKNEELNEANYVKEEYIGYVFTICSNYIGKLADMKRNIHLKAVTRKYKEILEDTADLDMKDELKEFYRSFDTIFLHIYPNFVNDFNTLLQDDKKIMPKEGELLNTELRIYALVRLGITDSVKIAEFLHCSPQTVYNNRFRVRNKANISKKEFADSVRTLGKFMDRTS